MVIRIVEPTLIDVRLSPTSGAKRANINSRFVQLPMS
jgi:hypothetical protein